MMTELGAGTAAAGDGVGSPAGEQSPTLPPRDLPAARVTLLTRVGCHLCDVAKAALTRLSAEHGFAWVELDVDAESGRADAYGDRVPVILVDGVEHGFWRVDEARLLWALRESSRGADDDGDDDGDDGTDAGSGAGAGRSRAGTGRPARRR